MLKAQIVHVLLQAEVYPSFAKQLLDSFQMPPIAMGSPSHIPRIVWDSGVLATLSYEQRLNAETRSIAQQFQYHSITTSDSIEAKSSALNIIANTLLEKTEFDNRSLEMWEAWVRCSESIAKVFQKCISTNISYKINPQFKSRFVAAKQYKESIR